MQFPPSGEKPPRSQVQPSVGQINVKDGDVVPKTLITDATEKDQSAHTQRQHGYPVVWDDERTPRARGEGR